MGLAQFGTLIDLKGIPELRESTVMADGTLRIGGGVTHREIERSAVVAAHLPALADLEGHLANVRVRNQGTIGGNLAFAEPHSRSGDAPSRLRRAHGARWAGRAASCASASSRSGRSTRPASRTRS